MNDPQKKITEHNEIIATRVPPGDRWVFANGSQKNVYPSLTDALEAWYQYAGDTNFYIEARNGTVEIIKQEEVEVPVKKFSLYGED